MFLPEAQPTFESSEALDAQVKLLRESSDGGTEEQRARFVLLVMTAMTGDAPRGGGHRQADHQSITPIRRHRVFNGTRTDDHVLVPMVLLEDCISSKNISMKLATPDIPKHSIKNIPIDPHHFMTHALGVECDSQQQDRCPTETQNLLRCLRLLRKTNKKRP